MSGLKKNQNWTLRERRSIYSIPDDNPEGEEIMNNARRKLETRRASAMLCNVTTPVNPNGKGDPLQVIGLRW